MSHSKQTANYGLPLFEPKDRPAWLTDFNGAMTAVDATVKWLEDSIQAGGLPITGGTMLGSINMGDHAITNVQEIELPKSGDGLYIGSVIQPDGTSGARLTGVTGASDNLGGAALVKPDKQSEYVNLSVATPSRPEHAATKQYVDVGVDEANQMAVNAYNTANEAAVAADAAQSTANGASAKADAAQSTANGASAKADAAQSTANDASAKADAAQSTANGASDKADAAQSTANDASAKADLAESDIQGLQNSKQDKAIQRKSGIPVASWMNNVATVTVQGVTASNIVIVSPAPESVSVWGESVVYCSAQAENSLTFTCSETPTAAIAVNVIILN